MIKVKIHNPKEDRNEPTFRVMLAMQPYFREVGIDFTTSNDYDFLFIGMNDFMNKKWSLEESVEWGSENVERLGENGDYFLFDGSDSTSIMGGVEVMRNTNPIYYLKNQFLDFDLYKKPYSFGRWFWGEGDNNFSYDLTEEDRSKMKLSGWNLGHLQGHLFEKSIPRVSSKPIDVCAIFQAKHRKNYEHTFRNDIPYTNHRKGVWNTLDKKFNSITEQLPYQDYIKKLRESKVAISPFGMGEVCFRDFEVMALGSILIKPDMKIVNTKPNIYIEGETYYGVKYDWSNLNEVIESVLNKNVNVVDKYREMYDAKHIVLHYYDLIKNLSGVETE
jgi:hypothetical protein|tara:strand:+ start:797 stop:1792 length:996 start_codon:yes stop_codon:yes gene_type:complete